MQQRQLEIGERRVCRIHEVPPALQRARPTAHQQRRQRTMRVAIAVADAAAVEQQDVVEQCPVAVRRRLELLEVRDEQPDVIGLDDGRAGRFARGRT